VDINHVFYGFLVVKYGIFIPQKREKNLQGVHVAQRGKYKSLIHLTVKKHMTLIPLTLIITSHNTY